MPDPDRSSERARTPMSNAAPSFATPVSHTAEGPSAPDLRLAIAEAAHLLPAQGPIGVFIHHNTLHAFQHLPFHEAIARASAELETQGYLPEATFRAAFARGRIDASDLDAVLCERFHDDVSLGPISQRALARIAMLHELPIDSEAHLRWRLDETDCLSRFRADVSSDVRTALVQSGVRWLATPSRREQSVPDPPLHSITEDPDSWVLRALWTLCQSVPSRRIERAAAPRVRSHRDLLRAVVGNDPAALINPFLIRFLAAYLDQGMASWKMPERERGLLACFRSFAGDSPPPPLSGLSKLFADAEKRRLGPEDLVREGLEAFGVDPSSWAAFLGRVLLELPGWAGMVHRLEHHPHEHEGTPPTLLEYLAIVLSCERVAITKLARRSLGYEGSLAELPAFLRRLDPRDDPVRPAREEAAFRLFNVCQLGGIDLEALSAMSDEQRRAIIDELDEFDEHERRRLWHEAYERHYREEVFAALASPVPTRESSPRWQVVFCIDDREESMRRHLEEVAPEVETLGTAGFFGLAIEYRGIDAGAHGAALCPVAIEPTHVVHEEPEPAERPRHERRQRTRRAVARITHMGSRSSRSLVRAAFMTPLLGLAAAFPLVTRVLFPRVAERLAAQARALLPKPRTVLTDTRDGEAIGKPRGFTLAEQIERVASTLESMGLTRAFAPIVLVLGHGSTSLNNPHESAHDCGACGGRHGGPNARLFAGLANRADVRAGLRARGIDVPDGTVFIGGIHNTANDAVELFETDRVPEPLRGELGALQKALDRARIRDAHERCRRFDDVPLDVSPRAALRHVEGRAGNLSQPRPEYGHATNAVCIIGRRALTRGLFLDRRAFLVSYDPSIDDNGAVLERLLVSVAPVGAGINLEYYFSVIDNDRYGSGTKLPHNITALLGVMDGHASDLRTGLPWEMVEIHEPVRLLTIVESTRERLLAIAEKHPHTVGELVAGHWIQLACIEDGRIFYFDPSRGEFTSWEPTSPREIPVVRTSLAHYRKRRDFVPIVRVESPDAR